MAVAIFTFVLRGIASPFAHPLFTLPFGIAIGLAVRRRSWLAKIVLPLLGYLMAVTLHGLWNGSALRGIGTFALGYVAIMLPAVGAAIGWRSGYAGARAGS